jgi:RimJ/RimL family protein N-acetyltransferase
MLDAGHGWVRREMPEIALLRAEIRPDNAASRAAFESAGFRVAAAYEDRLEYHAMVQRNGSSPS